MIISSDACSIESDIRVSRRVHIINPIAGGGRYAAGIKEKLALTGEAYAVTEYPGHAAALAERFCTEDPHTRICVYGGDGTAADAVCGILRAGAGKSAVLTCLPAGSGNDFAGFINNIKTEGNVFPLDVMRSDERCAVNIVNGGFDCGVVARTEKLRARGVNGKLSYILGVIAELALKRSYRGTVRLYEEVSTDGAETPLPGGEISGDFLLCAIAGARYYGGGFCAAPLADPCDGYMDLILVKNVPRRTFVSLVGDYKAGRHLLPDGTVREQFRHLVAFHRCRRIETEGIPFFCFDGEVTPVKTLRLECLPGAVYYQKPEDELCSLL